MRVLIDLPDEDLASLDAMAMRHGRSRAAEVREAVRVHLQARAGDNWISRGLGYWQDRADIHDGLAFQVAQRDGSGSGA